MTKLSVCFVLFACALLSEAFSPTNVRRSASCRLESTALQALTLFGHPGTRSPLVNWAAYELGLDLLEGDLGENPHPFGQIPCLTDNDVMVFESGAILVYLIGKAKSDLTDPQKALVTSWISWANASLDPICFLETPGGKV
jgi:glutathione S-transferase